MTGPEIGPIAAGEFRAFHACFMEACGADVDEADLTADAAILEPARTLAAREGEAIVGTTLAYSRRLSVPGASVPLAAVSYVSVHPAHQGRGLLTRLAHRQLRDLMESGAEPVAGLFAAQPGLYERFGYGAATRWGRLRVSRDPGRGKPDVGNVAVVARDEALPRMADLYARLLPAMPGWLDRPPAWWHRRLHDPEGSREGTAFRFALHREPSGDVTAYALYRHGAPSGNGGGHGLVLSELAAGTAEAHGAIWHFLTGMDLVDHVDYHLGAPADPVRFRASGLHVTRCEPVDAMSLRLVDAGRALAARRYTGHVDLVLEVTDEVCPWNARRWHLRADGADVECGPASRSPDLHLDVAALGAVYLGGIRFGDMVTAGRVRECRPGALVDADSAFMAAREPSSPEGF